MFIMTTNLHLLTNDVLIHTPSFLFLELFFLPHFSKGFL